MKLSRRKRLERLVKKAKARAMRLERGAAVVAHQEGGGTVHWIPEGPALNRAHLAWVRYERLRAASECRARKPLLAR